MPRSFMSGLTPVVVTSIENARFSKTDVAKAFGCQQYEISRDVQILWGKKFNYISIGPSEVEALYAVRCFRQFMHDVAGKREVSAASITQFIDSGDEFIWKHCSLVGGSLEDCKERMNGMLREKLETIKSGEKNAAI